MDGIEATRRILASHPNIKVIGLSMHVDETVARAMRDAGAVAYLTKGGRSDDLIGTIRTCCKGQPASAI
jgi:two-component system NarL family response regulator